MSIESPAEKQVSWFVVAIIISIILAIAVWFSISDDENIPPVVIEAPVEIIEQTVTPIIEEVVEQPPVVETTELTTTPEPVKIALPKLDDSDPIIIAKLPQVTWRKELLKLVVTDDLVRRFVVFTDNFAQGNISYEHSPFVLLTEKFQAKESTEQTTDGESWEWNEASTQRFSLYVDLLRSMDSGELVDLYFEVKPLIDQAYQELGYPEQDFTKVLQASITRVLDMEILEDNPKLLRPSVMYKYQNEVLESLDESDKLLLRIGKENVLVIKSVLLELNDKISRTENN